MTPDTDALVSELRVWAQTVGVPSRLSQCLTGAADAAMDTLKSGDDTGNEIDGEDLAGRADGLGRGPEQHRP